MRDIIHKAIETALTEYTDQQIGELLYQCRDQSGLTQVYMAKQLHFDRTHLTKIEDGKRSVKRIKSIEPSEFILGWLSITDQTHYFIAKVSNDEKLMESVRALGTLHHIQQLFNPTGDAA